MKRVRSLLANIFAGHPKDFNIRLWDDRLIEWSRAPRFTLVFRDKNTFKKIIMNGDALTAGAAFIENKLDIEGDIFAAVRLSDYLGDLKLSFRDRMNIFAKLVAL
jgi:hypothetical protein